MTTPATPAVPPAQDEWLKEATRLADEAVCLGTPHKTNVAYAALLSHLAARGRQAFQAGIEWERLAARPAAPQEPVSRRVHLAQTGDQITEPGWYWDSTAEEFLKIESIEQTVYKPGILRSDYPQHVAGKVKSLLCRGSTWHGDWGGPFVGPLTLANITTGPVGALSIIADIWQHMLDYNCDGDPSYQGQCRVWPEAPTAPVVRRWIETLRAAASAPAASPTRTPQDYAIEHAEYMALGAEQFIEASNALAFAVHAEDEAMVEACREDESELRGALRNLIYEFRKRRDRALASAPAVPQPLTWEQAVNATITDHAVRDQLLSREAPAVPQAAVDVMAERERQK